MRPSSILRPVLALFVSAITVGSMAAHAQIARNTVASPGHPVLTVGFPGISLSPEGTAAMQLMPAKDLHAVMDLPDAPSADASAAEGQAGALSLAPSTSPIAPKYQGIILPKQAAQPLAPREKVKFGFVSAIQPVNILAWGISSAYSQAVDSAPHYGQGWGPYGQRYGAAAARGTMQILATDSIFSPIFHDDPRYYELGSRHNFLSRVVYAGTRTVITRTDRGKQTVNLPLLAGYAVAAGVDNVFYPQRDRNATQAIESYGGSLGGAALGFLFNEFLDDGLRMVHERH